MRRSPVNGPGSSMLTDTVLQNPCGPVCHRPLQAGEPIIPATAGYPHKCISGHHIRSAYAAASSPTDPSSSFNRVSPPARHVPIRCSANRRADERSQAAAQFVSTWRDNRQFTPRPSKNLKKPSRTHGLSARLAPLTLQENQVAQRLFWDRRTIASTHHGQAIRTTTDGNHTRRIVPATQSRARGGIGVQRHSAL